MHVAWFTLQPRCVAFSEAVPKMCPAHLTAPLRLCGQLLASSKPGRLATSWVPHAVLHVSGKSPPRLTLLQTTPICRLRTSTLDLGAAVKKSPEYLFRYDQQGASKEPLPMYAQVKLDASGMKLAWTDNTVAGVFYADRIHITELARGTDGSFTVSSDRVISGREVRGMFTHRSGWTAVLVRTSGRAVARHYDRHRRRGSRAAFVQVLPLLSCISPGCTNRNRKQAQQSPNWAAFVQNMEIRRYWDSDDARETRGLPLGTESSGCTSKCRRARWTTGTRATRGSWPTRARAPSRPASRGAVGTERAWP